MKYGVILMRAQPFHKGHLYVIQKILEENDKALIVIGSANKSKTKRNPLPIEKRVEIVRNVLIEYDLQLKVDVITLNDWSMEDAYQYAKEWGNFFYYNVVNAVKSKTFTLYYNDDLEIVKNWFVNELLERITIKNMDRTTDVSSTNIRKAIANDDLEYLREALCPSTIEVIHEIKRMLEEAVEDDYMMT